MDAERLLARLRDERADGPLAELADLAAAELLRRPLGELVDPEASAAAVAHLAEELVASDTAFDTLEARIEALVKALEEDDEPLGERFSEEVRGFLAELAERPWAPDREILVAWLDRGPVRRLLRRLLTEALVGFGKRLGSPVVESRITRGLGDLGRLARDTALGRAGAFGAIATDLVGAFSSEMERQLERRAAEFADVALSGLLHRLADLLGDPELAEEQAELRQALLDGLLELTGAQVGAEMRRFDPATAARVARRWIERWLARDDGEEALARAIARLLGADADRPVSELLAEMGLEEAARAVCADLLEARMRTVVEGETFAAWFRRLLAGA